MIVISMIGPVLSIRDSSLLIQNSQITSITHYSFDYPVIKVDSCSFTIKNTEVSYIGNNNRRQTAQPIFLIRTSTGIIDQLNASVFNVTLLSFKESSVNITNSIVSDATNYDMPGLVITAMATVLTINNSHFN
jgi:hypothetical protein